MAITKLMLISEKLLLGITLAAPIGPVSVEMIRRGLKNGFWSAFSVRLGGAIGNAFSLLATYFGLAQIMSYPLIINTLGLFGACLLFYMGISTLSTQTVMIDFSKNSQVKNGLIWGVYLAIVNPIALVFWPSIFTASLNENTKINIFGLIENSFIILGVLLWGAGLSLLLEFGRHFLKQTAIYVVNKISGVLMLVFSFKYGCKVFMRLL